MPLSISSQRPGRGRPVTSEAATSEGRNEAVRLVVVLFVGSVTTYTFLQKWLENVGTWL